VRPARNPLPIGHRGFRAAPPTTFTSSTTTVSNRLRSRGLSTSSSESRSPTAWASGALAGIDGFHPSPGSSVGSCDSRRPCLPRVSPPRVRRPAPFVRTRESRVPRPAASVSPAVAEARSSRVASGGGDDARRGTRLSLSRPASAENRHPEGRTPSAGVRPEGRLRTLRVEQRYIRLEEPELPRLLAPDLPSSRDSGTASESHLNEAMRTLWSRPRTVARSRHRLERHWRSFAPAARRSDGSRLSGSLSGVGLSSSASVTGLAGRDLAEGA